MTKYLTEQDVADLTGRALPTLQKDRRYGRGIPYLKIGRQVRYKISDVEQFMDSCRVEVTPLSFSENP